MGTKEILSDQQQSNDYSKWEDAHLVELSLEGDRAAFGELIDRYWKVVTVLVYNRIGNHTDAEDVVQETFIKAYKKLSSLRNPEKFAPWVYNIATTTSIDFMRKRQRQKTLPLEEVKENISAGIFEKKKNEFPWTENVLRAVKSLPEKYYIVVTLRYFKGMSYRQIADHLGEPSGTISNRLYRANKLLKEWMDYPPSQDDS